MTFDGREWNPRCGNLSVGTVGKSNWKESMHRITIRFAALSALLLIFSAVAPALAQDDDGPTLVTEVEGISEYRLGTHMGH